MLNNRELASLFWLGVVAVWVLWRSETRKSLFQVLTIVAQPRLLISLLLLVGNVVGVTYAGWRVGLWTSDLVPELVVWFFGSVLVVLFNIGEMTQRRGFVRRVLAKVLKVTLLLEAFLNLFVFGLVGEIILQPVVFLLLTIPIFSGTKPEYQQVKRLVEHATALLGFAMFGYAVVRLIAEWGDFNELGAFRELVLPVWMTPGVIPFLYVFSLFMNYESAFTRIDRFGEGHRRWPIKLAVLSVLHGRTHAAANLRGSWLQRLGRARSFREARAITKEYKRSL